MSDTSHITCNYIPYVCKHLVFFTLPEKWDNFCSNLCYRYSSRIAGYISSTLPGEGLNTHIAEVYNPWKPLIDQAHQQEIAIPLLKVIWRTQLGHPYLPPDPTRGYGSVHRHILVMVMIIYLQVTSVFISLISTL